MATTPIEFVRSHALPKGLVIRVATGRAIDALVLYKAGRDLTPERGRWLSHAADLLRPTTVDEPLRAGRSVADYRKDIGLIRAARRVWDSPEASDLALRLASAADWLDRLASGEVASTDQIDELIKALRAFREALSPSLPKFTERVAKPSA
jgi:hypothetical protein